MDTIVRTAAEDFIKGDRRNPLQWRLVGGTFVDRSNLFRLQHNFPEPEVIRDLMRKDVGEENYEAFIVAAREGLSSSNRVIALQSIAILGTGLLVPSFEEELAERLDYHYRVIAENILKDVTVIPEDYFLIAFMAAEALAHYKNERALDFLKFVIALDMMFTTQMQNRALLGIADLVGRKEAAEIAFNSMKWQDPEKFRLLRQITPEENRAIIVEHLAPVIADYTQWPPDKVIDEQTFYFLNGAARFLNGYRSSHPDQFPDELSDKLLYISDSWFKSDQDQMKEIANRMLVVVLDKGDDNRIIRGIDPQLNADVSQNLLAWLPNLPRERLEPLTPLLMAYIDHPTHARYALDSLIKIRTGYRGGNAFNPDELKEQIERHKAWFENEFLPDSDAQRQKESNAPSGY